MSRRKPRSHFSQIENEREQQRKMYEENLKRKKEELYFEFEKQEEVSKYSQMSVQSRNDVKFKYELDKVVTYMSNKEQELKELKDLLRDLQDARNATQPLEAPHSMFAPAQAHNFTSIFSKSYYRSSGVQMLGAVEQKQRNEVNNYNKYLEDEINQKIESSKNEHQRQLQLEAQHNELFKIKQKLVTKLHDLEYLNQTADIRFVDAPSVQYISQEKKTAIQRDLLQAKSELKEYTDLGEQFKEKQSHRMKEGEKMRKTAEEIITHDMLRKDELERECAQLDHQVQLEDLKEQAIIEKRSESKYTLKFIEVFCMLERLFCEREVKEQEIKQLYEINQHSSRQLEEFNENEEIISKQKINTGNENNYGDNQLSEDYQQEKKVSTDTQSRLSIIQAINKFDSQHPNGAKALLNQLIKIHSEMAFRQEEMTLVHNQLLQSKKKLQDILQQSSDELKILKEKNSFIELMATDPKIEEEMLNKVEAFDSGVVLIQNNDKSQQKGHNHQGGISSKFSTVNILKMENFEGENEKLKEQVKRNQNFVFNFLSNYSESAVRLSQTISLIDAASFGISPAELNNLAKQMAQYVRDIWEGKVEETDTNESLNYPVNKRQKRKKKKLSSFFKMDEALEVEEISEGSFKKVQNEKFSQDEIRAAFMEVFPGQLKEADMFYDLMKEERMIWFFCSLDQVKLYLKDIPRNDILSVFQNIDQLREVGVNHFQHKLNEICEMKIGLVKAMNTQSQISLRVVRATYPDYNIKRTKKLKTLRDNEEIRETKLRFITKNENYFRNNEPLQEDFFILQGDGGAETEREAIENDGDGNNTGNKNTMNMKKKEDKNSDQINKLIEQIRKSKNGGKQIILEQKKYNAQQMNKERAKLLATKNSSEDNENSNNNIEGNKNNQNDNKNQSQQQSQQQQQQQQQPQQVLQSQQASLTNLGMIGMTQSQLLHQDKTNNGSQNNSPGLKSQQSASQQSHRNNTTDSIDHRNASLSFRAQANLEEIVKIKAFNAQEETAIIEERERVHNLSKRLLEEQQKKLDHDSQNKNNKFFVSDQISKINERLLQENKSSEQKEKLMRGIADNQDVLSKVDRMDRFAGYIGPSVLKALQDEKTELVRSLRGELFQPELNYLKANDCYNIRKSINNEQRSVLQERKMQHQLQPGVIIQQREKQQQQQQQLSLQQSRSQFRSTHSSVNRGIKGDIELEDEIQFQAKKSQINGRSASEENQYKKIAKRIKDIKPINVPTGQLSQSSSQYPILPDTRPQTQGSTRFDMIRNASGSISTKAIRHQSGSHSNRAMMQPIPLTAKRLNTPLSGSQGYAFGFSDFLSSDNSYAEQFQSGNSQNKINNMSVSGMQNNNNKSSTGPYSAQNMKFYQRYTSQEGNAMFDFLLNEQGSKRPSTQQFNQRNQGKLISPTNNSINNNNLILDLTSLNTQKVGLHYQVGKNQKPDEGSPGGKIESKMTDEVDLAGAFTGSSNSQRFYEMGSSPSGSSSRTTFTTSRANKNKKISQQQNYKNQITSRTGEEQE